MKRALLLLVVLGSVLPACDDAAQPSPEPHRSTTSQSSTASGEQGSVGRWKAPRDYSFRVRSRCGEQNFIGTFDIVVANGKVAKAKGNNEQATAALQFMDAPSLSELLNLARKAKREGAEVAEVNYDESDGHPKKIEIDYSLNTIDDESCFFITRYKA